MGREKVALFICSENPFIIKNGITAALNTSLRTLQSICNTVDIYIHKSKKYNIFPDYIGTTREFEEIELLKYDFIFLSPVNIAYYYLVYYRNIRRSKVYCFLSDTYSYTLYRSFILSVKFNKFFFKFLLKLPVIYLLEKYVELYSLNVFLQTSFDVKIFNKIYHSKKAIEFPNSPILKDIEISDISLRQGIGWIASFTDDYYYLSKWFFKYVLSSLLMKNQDIKIHIHGQNCLKLKAFIDIHYPKNNFKISFTEYLDNLSSLYLDTKIIICPVYKGYGLINKTIEGMYYGCIVIGDPASFNGIKGAKDGLNCFIAQSNKDFIKKIEYTYSKSKELNQISRLANLTIKNEFGIDNNIRILKYVLDV